MSESQNGNEWTDTFVPPFLKGKKQVLAPPFRTSETPARALGRRNHFFKDVPDDQGLQK